MIKDYKLLVKVKEEKSTRTMKQQGTNSNSGNSSAENHWRPGERSEKVSHRMAFLYTRYQVTCLFGPTYLHPYVIMYFGTEISTVMSYLEENIYLMNFHGISIKH